jgi:TolA-binding protein
VLKVNQEEMLGVWPPRPGNYDRPPPMRVYDGTTYSYAKPPQSPEQILNEKITKLNEKITKLNEKITKLNEKFNKLREEFEELKSSISQNR